MSASSKLPAKTLEPAILAAVRLSLVPGIGPRTYAQLVAAFGGPEQVLRAAPADLRALPGIGAKLARDVAFATQQVDVDDELQRCADFGIDILEVHSDTYPRRLKEIYDPPAVLFCQGRLLPQDDLAIAIVGTRHASPYGLVQAERFAKGLALAGMSAFVSVSK